MLIFKFSFSAICGIDQDFKWARFVVWDTLEQVFSIVLWRIPKSHHQVVASWSWWSYLDAIYWVISFRRGRWTFIILHPCISYSFLKAKDECFSKGPHSLIIFTNLLNTAKDPSCFEGLAFISLWLAISCAFILLHQFIREEFRVCSAQLLVFIVAIHKSFRILQIAHSFAVI